MTSDATPDTPVDPRETPRAELDHVYDFLYNQELIVENVTGQAYQPTMTTAIRIANALADVGLLAVSDEGSLPSLRHSDGDRGGIVTYHGSDIRQPVLAKRRPTLIALLGPPGAGKTSLRAHWPTATVVSLDDNRRALSWCGCPSNQDPTLRAHAINLGFSTTRSALAAGRTVLWDATNAERADRAALLLLAAESGAEALAHVQLPPLPVVLARNANRSSTPCWCGHTRRVPEPVVRHMHAQITAAVPGLGAEGWTLSTTTITERTSQ